MFVSSAADLSVFLFVNGINQEVAGSFPEIQGISRSWAGEELIKF